MTCTGGTRARRSRSYGYGSNGALQPHGVHRYLDKAAVSERILKAAAG
ncbi:hypothetical protein ACIRO3_23860 [Streptomyces sp. NPDC102278]